MSFKEKTMRVTHHPILAQPAISLALTALSLLLLVLVLLSVPGPIKGLYWFSVSGNVSGMGKLSAGVLGWCEVDTSNCTYGPLSDNAYLSTVIDTGMALTVRLMLPLACYWAIVVLCLWVGLAILSPMGYKIVDLDSVSRHLKFAVVEAVVLCVTLFGNVLSWLAFGLGRQAYLTVQSSGGQPTSGHAMETTAVAALMSLFSLFTAVWGLHLRLKGAQKRWKDEAVMVRRRSMMLAGTGGAGSEERRMSALGVQVEKGSIRGGQWDTSVPAPGYRGSMVKDATYDTEEHLDDRLDVARQNSRDQEMIRRASMISPHDTPYGAAANAQRAST